MNLLGHHHEEVCDIETTSHVLARHHARAAKPVTALSALYLTQAHMPMDQEES
jgi:hypothetical protein